MRDINPLNVLNQREVSMMPEHFTQIVHKFNYMGLGKTHNDIVDNIKHWIFNNLDGRYTVSDYGKSTSKDAWEEFDYTDEFENLHNDWNTSKYDVEVTIGFEVPEESTFFSLAYQLPE